MDSRFTKNVVALLLLCLVAGSAWAQETFTLNPKRMTPADSGYYVSGNTKLVDGDSVKFSGCEDGYGDDDHREEGEQQGFHYSGVIIMNDCPGKGTPEAEPSNGYVQITKHKNAGTDSADYGYIVCPPVTDLQSVEIVMGTDLSTHGRTIIFALQPSFDNGQTWDQNLTYIYPNKMNQGATRYTIAAGESNSPQFENIVQRSQSEPVFLRLISWKHADERNGERLKVFELSITGTESDAVYQGGDGGPTGDILAVDDVSDSKPFFTVANSTISATSGSINVYSYTGSLVGSGEAVNVSPGLYIVKSESGGATKKVLIQ